MQVLRSALLLFALSALAACAPDTFRATDITGAEFARKLELTGHDGKPRSLADFRGKVVMLFFGYTNCPDMCPTTMALLASAVRQLGKEDARDVQVLFATVDPKRDTPQVLAQYVPAFHPRLIGLTGTPEEIEAVKRAYRVYARKADGSEGADYLVDHSTFVYLMGPDGAYVAHFSHVITAEEMADRLLALVTAAS